MVILAMGRGLYNSKSQPFKHQVLSNPFKHQTSDYFETVAFWFKTFNKQMKQKSKHNCNKKYKKKFLLISLALFPIK